jgi:hypothetical protein
MQARSVAQNFYPAGLGRVIIICNELFAARDLFEMTRFLRGVLSRPLRSRDTMATGAT